MISKKVILHETNGLHARPAMKVVEKCKSFHSKVTICKGCEMASGCSILELMMLNAKDGVELEIIASGDDENNAVKELQHMFENGAGI